MALQGTRLDRMLDTLKQAAKMYEKKIDSLIQDQHEYQNWESRGMSLRDTILILDGINITLKSSLIENTIKMRNIEMIDTKYHSLAVLSSKLDYTDKEINSWKKFNYDELEKQKYECMKQYKKNFDETLESLNAIEQLIRNTEREKSRLLYITVSSQVIGLFLILLSKI